MAPTAQNIPGGPYAISRPREQLATLEGGSANAGTPVVLLPPTGQPGEQEVSCVAVCSQCFF
jgi:hypothetical protein